MVNPTLLCGSMFGLKTYRHRLFETSFLMPLVMHMPHGLLNDKLTGPSQERERDMVVVVGHPGYKVAAQKYKEAMQIDWMTTDEITEAIPPAYTKFIGEHLMKHLERR